jgi:hypothetical protein
VINKKEKNKRKIDLKIKRDQEKNTAQDQGKYKIKLYFLLGQILSTKKYLM